MSLGRVALGIASIALGLNSLRNGVKHLSGHGSAGGLRGHDPRRNPRIESNFMDREAMPAPVSRGARGLQMPGQAFANSGYSTVRAPDGTNVPMQMRSFNIRTLDDRIGYLKRLVDAGKRDPQVYAFGRRAVTRRCGNKWCIDEKDNLSEAKAIFDAVRQTRGRLNGAGGMGDVATARKLFRQIRDQVRYTSDIAGVDTYQKPAHTLALKSGDCDDYSTLTCATLQSVGIPCRFKVIRTKGAGDWNHIYPQAGFPRAKPTRWVSMDSSVNMPFGWEAPPKMVAASRVFPVG
jgi:hypothetical protein